ncbi:hypothetical protein K533_10510 [Salmonella enterica subsp. enterica serovar Cubana str. CVM42234]|nr:hypothetical protein CFSAN002050_15805 [Salmonella enterica subsp. enterica serovar Cubana str. CFSAN002050]ESV51122.1 hypothetical protein K533_10510 [Salmonella enterica subsp. enterica serovar Cubana str. CVM42234]
MNDAQLDMGLREDAVYRIREALQTIHTGNQDVLNIRKKQVFIAHYCGIPCPARYNVPHSPGAVNIMFS